MTTMELRRETDQIAISQIFDQQKTAWNSGDAAAFGALFSEDADYTVWNGIYDKGRESIVRSHAHIFSTFYKDSQLEGEISWTRFLGEDVALVQLEGQITLANGHPAGYPTKPLAVLHCQNGKWLITAWQNTPVMTHTFADPPPPKQTPTLLQPGEGETLLEVIGQRVVTAKVKSVETGGRWSLVEYVAPPHFTGPPPHFHREMSESFYVLSGELSVAVENEVSTHSAGSFVNVPAGMTHTFANQLDHPTTFLIWMSPGGFEQYFADLHQLIATEGGQWPLSDMRKVAVIEQKYDINYPQQSS